MSVMIAQLENECISLSVLSMARVQFPVMAEYFKDIFPGWSHSASPSWASVSENSSISPQWHHTTCGHRGGRLESNHGQTLAQRKISRYTYQMHWAIALYPSLQRICVAMIMIPEESPGLWTVNSPLIWSVLVYPVTLLLSPGSWRLLLMTKVGLD